MRKTKIVCTVGPACADEKTLTDLCLAGMNVARLNFSHGSHEDHLQKIELIKKVRKKLNMPIAILLDTKGPEYRIRTFKNGKVRIKADDIFTFRCTDSEGDEKGVSVNYKDLYKDMNPGDRILVNNGLLIFEVLHIKGTDVVTKVIAGGEISNRKSMSFPDKVLSKVYLSEQDKSDIRFGIENDIDFIACSFVSCKEDLIDVKNYIRSEFPEANVDIIAKIENRRGVDNIEAICSECDGIMIARGDMGVEIPFEHLPAIQKSLITKCRLLGKRVITATEMLESMIHNPRPTRAEISDVANAVYDGTSAIMLSGETAMGDYPVLTVKTMARIAEQTEQAINYTKRFLSYEFKIKNTVDAISHATCGMSIDLEAKAIVVCSLSGSTVRMVSRFRAPCPIVGITVNEKTWRKLALNWAVTPVLGEMYPSTEVLFYSALKESKKLLNLKKGDRIIVTGGITNGQSGNTNLIKIETI